MIFNSVRFVFIILIKKEEEEEEEMGVYHLLFWYLIN
jgi:hypothetical protein